MRLIFFYLQHRRAEYYFRFFNTEGYFWLLKRMVETGVVSEVLIVIDSLQQTKPLQYMTGMTAISVQGILNIPGGIRPDDIIWVRGGWREWFSGLQELKKQHHKLLLYAANSGRERWPFWDIIFDDLNGKDFVDSAGRMHVDFRKPTNPEIFRPIKMEQIFDVCIGASHVHDKKGQWRGIKAAIEYQNIFGKKLKCILPGAFGRGIKTNRMMDDIQKHNLDIELPGMIPRHDMATVYNQSKLFLHLGTGGQGDRGVLEAMSCGCPVMIGYPKRHAPFVYKTDLSYVAADPDHFSTLAHEIHAQLELSDLELSDEEKRMNIFEYHEAQCGIETVILPKMKELFQKLYGGNIS